MKKCPWCGKEYSDESYVCAVDGNPLPTSDSASAILILGLPVSEDKFVEKKTSKPKSWERKLFRLTVMIYLGLLFFSVVPGAGLIVYIPFFCTGLLWCYTGLLAVIMIFPIAFFMAVRRRKKLVASLLSAGRWSVIGFGALGLLMWVSVFVTPGYKSFTRGYWIHTKIWLNVDQVRRWAAGRPGSPDPMQTVPYSQWPSTMRPAVFGHGRLHVDPDTKTVTLVNGGALSGHWGIIVAQKGQPLEGHGDLTIKLEDSAWVWHDVE